MFDRMYKADGNYEYDINEAKLLELDLNIPKQRIKIEEFTEYYRKWIFPVDAEINLTSM